MPDPTPPTPEPAVPAPAPQPAPPAAQTVPYADFARAIQARDEARATATAAAERLAQLEAATKAIPTLQQELEQWKGKASDSEARYGNLRTIAATGIVEPELVDAIEAHWRAMPASSRPKLPDLLAEWRGTEETGPALDKVPLLLRPHLEAKWKPPAQPAQPAAAQPQPRGGHVGSAARGAPGQPATDANAIYEAMARRMRGEITEEQYQQVIRAR